MIDSYYPNSVSEYEAGLRRRRIAIWGALLALTFITFGIMGVLPMLAPRTSPIIGLAASLVLIVCILGPIAIWKNPMLGFFFLVATTLVGTAKQGAFWPNVPTSYIAVWWSLPTIGRAFLNTNALEPFPVTVAEIIIVMVAVFWFIRKLTAKELTFEQGDFSRIILAYVGLMVFAFANGVGNGGDLTIGLLCLRPPVYFMIGYFMACNFIKEKKHMTLLLTIFLVGIGIQGLCAMNSYFAVGGVIDESGIPGIDHSDSLYFNIFVLAYFVLSMSAVHGKLKWSFAALLPIVVFAILNNQRRAGIGAFIVAMIVLVPMLYAVLKHRRLQIGRFAAVFFAIMAVYLPIAWNGKGAWALPARAIKSISSPDARDASSNDYRVVEDMNLKATRDAYPVLGMGFGKAFLRPFYLPTIAFTQGDYFPHNNVLWMWASLGHAGFLLFMMFWATLIIRGTMILRTVRHPMVITVGLLALLQVLMLFIYGKYDMQLINWRMMFLTGVLVGILGNLKKIDEYWTKEYGEPELGKKNECLLPTTEQAVA